MSTLFRKKRPHPPHPTVVVPNHLLPDDNTNQNDTTATIPVVLSSADTDVSIDDIQGNNDRSDHNEEQGTIAVITSSTNTTGSITSDCKRERNDNHSTTPITVFTKTATTSTVLHASGGENIGITSHLCRSRFPHCIIIGIEKCNDIP